MAKRSFQVPTWSPAAIADTTTMANAGFMAVGAAAATNGLLVSEIEINGLAAASSVMLMQFARDSALAATPTALAAPNSDGPMNSLTAAAQVGSLTCVAATTNPSRSAVTTSSRLNLGLNAFGGISRWVAYPGEEWGIIGITVSISESALSNFTGGATAAIGSHIIYEAY